MALGDLTWNDPQASLDRRCRWPKVLVSTLHTDVTLSFDTAMMPSEAATLTHIYSCHITFSNVEPKHQGTAGMMAAFFLIFGIFAGVTFSLPVTLFIEQVTYMKLFTKQNWSHQKNSFIYLNLTQFIFCFLYKRISVYKQSRVTIQLIV